MSYWWIVAVLGIIGVAYSLVSIAAPADEAEQHESDDEQRAYLNEWRKK